MADTVTIEALTKGIKEGLKKGFPDFQTVDDYPTVEGAISTPAAFLNLSAIEPDNQDGTGRLVTVLRWEISVVLGKVPTQEVKRNTRILAANLALWVQGNRFSLPVREAGFVRAEPDEFSPTLSRYAPWVVEFEQSVPLGESVWDGTAIVPDTVYVSWEPDTGPDHVEDYVEVVSE